MVSIDFICPLYHGDKYIDGFLARLACQKDVTIHRGVFVITDDGSDLSYVTDRIEKAGYTYTLLPKAEFSHSTSRETAMYESCESELVVMLSQDVELIGEDALFTLASAIEGDVVFAYGRQIASKNTIERYIRQKNYGPDPLTVSQADVEKMGFVAYQASDAFAVYHRPTFLELGGYDGHPMMMNEDMYYAKKVLDAGLKKAYVPTAVVEHSHHFKLRQLYARYYDTGVWLATYPEFDTKTTDSGMSLAISVLKQALRHLNIPVLFRFLPDMAARYLGMKRGKAHTKKARGENA